MQQTLTIFEYNCSIILFIRVFFLRFFISFLFIVFIYFSFLFSLFFTNNFRIIVTMLFQSTLIVPKIFLTNHKEVNVPTVPVTSNIAEQIKPIYPKYNRYVISILDASKERNQNILQIKVYNAVEPGAKKENHHQR